MKDFLSFGGEADEGKGWSGFKGEERKEGAVMVIKEGGGRRWSFVFDVSRDLCHPKMERM